MAHQMVSDRAGISLENRWIGTASSAPEPAEAKWPRGWRYLLLLGTPLLFWAGVFAAIHWA